jgi:Beta-galactosidase
MMNRREFLSTTLAGGIAAISKPRLASGKVLNHRQPDAVSTTTRLSIAEYAPYRSAPPEIAQQRLDLYKALGCGALRLGVGWWDLETSEGHWRELPVLGYFDRAKANGFRFRLEVGTVGAPPAWYLDAHPEAKIRDQQDEFSKADIAPWYPGIRSVLAEKTDALLAYLARVKVLEATDWVFVDLGPAGEPVYPTAWTMKKSSCKELTPWYYGDQARVDFRRAMTKKYKSLDQANRIWGTRFASWTEVRPISPGERPAAMWEDVLLWYRDSKRAFIRWQVENYKQALHRHAPGEITGLIIMIPGSHISPGEWRQAVTSGRPDCSITIMTDSEFLLGLAREYGCVVQCTGAENAPEVRYLRQYMIANKLAMPFWAENAGIEAVARNPERIVSIIEDNNLDGFEYVNSSYLFRSDGVTPSDTYQALSRACSRLKQIFAGRVDASPR